ncbi:unnamed protein product [Musa hybrid cultivar]
MDRDSEMSTGSVVAGSSSSDLGRQSGDSGPSNKWNDQPTVSTMAVSPPKTARAPAKGSHRVSCLVDGCTADLSKGREYHRRHKVCELHFKTPVLMVHRQQQRFCQQCSRFQLVEEFDEVKRSCRRRLAGHNKRRRKPQPCSINPGILFPDHQGLLFVETTFGEEISHEPTICMKLSIYCESANGSKDPPDLCRSAES